MGNRIFKLTPWFCGLVLCGPLSAQPSTQNSDMQVSGVAQSGSSAKVGERAPAVVAADAATEGAWALTSVSAPVPVTAASTKIVKSIDPDARTPRVRTWMAIQLAAVLVVVAVGIFVYRRPKRHVRRSLANLRDDVTSLLQDMEKTGHSDAEVFYALSRVLPLIEREVGRADASVKAQVPTQDTAAEMVDLSRRPLRLSTASPEQVKRLFETVGRQT